MSRPLRIVYLLAWYHIMNRGRRSEAIFSGKEDFQMFIVRLLTVKNRLDPFSDSRKRYQSYIKEGFYQGGKPELVGGGLVRSLGGWAAVKKIRLKGQDRVKGDERILRDGDFVTELLAEANERLDLRYELKSLRYDIETIGQRVSKIFGIKKEEMYSNGRRKIQVEDRDLMSYWVVRELEMSCTDVAKFLGMSQPGVVYAVRRGEKIAKEHKYQLHE